MRKLFCLLFAISTLCICGQTNYVKAAKVSNTLIPNIPLPGLPNLNRTYAIGPDIYVTNDFNSLVKIDSNYNVIYSKTFGFPLTTNNTSKVAGVAGVTNNRLVMCSQSLLGNKVVSNVTFINSITGNIIWSKTIDSVAAMNVKYKNNKISIFGYLNNYSYLINIDTNGNLVNTKKIKLDYTNSIPFPSTTHSYSLAAGDIGNDSSFVFISVQNGDTSSGFKVTKLDKNENLLWSYEFKLHNLNAANIYGSYLLATKDGGVLLYIVDQGKLYKIDKNGHFVWQNNYYSAIKQILFEKPDGKILTVSEDDDFKLYDANGNILLYKIPSCNPKFQERIIAFFQNHFTFLYPINTTPYPCLTFTSNTQADALIYKNDYSFSGCAFGAPTISTYSAYVVTKGDSSINFLPYTSSLTTLSYSISNQSPTITIINDACSPLGIKENKLNTSISLYPNPAQDVISFVAENNEIAVVSILNSLGQQCMRITPSATEKQSVTISALAKGLYFVNFYSVNNELIGTKKLIKQ